MSENVRICRHCLLREMTDQNNYAESVEFYRSTLSERQRTPNDVYEQRLQVCKTCDALENGTCRQCGCYVEMRAARRDMHCPIQGRW